MRYLLFVSVMAFLACLSGCGGGDGTPDGYSLDDGWVTTPTGLKYRDIYLSPTGNQVVSGSSVSVYYTGTLDDGSVFDSTDNHGGQAFTFVIGQGNVIEGWDQGLMGLRAGSRTMLIIPPSLAYGDQAVNDIPANSTLHFTIEIVSVD